MIVEGIVTTTNSDGTTNIAPMGPLCQDDELATFELRPFCSSNTYQNIKRTGQGVLHICDDVLLFARAAVGTDLNDIELEMAQEVSVECLVECCRRYEFVTTWTEDSGNRASFLCKTVHASRVQDFFGFNRARHSVIEACILATRVDFLPIQEIKSQFEHHAVVINKTGGEREQQAFRLLNDYVTQRAERGQEAQK